MMPFFHNKEKDNVLFKVLVLVQYLLKLSVLKLEPRNSPNCFWQNLGNGQNWRENLDLKFLYLIGISRRDRGEKTVL